MNGKMGAAIFFYQYARYTNKEFYEDVAGELIDEIYEQINNCKVVDFPNGLLGMGWGVEYLTQIFTVNSDA